MKNNNTDNLYNSFKVNNLLARKLAAYKFTDEDANDLVSKFINNKIDNKNKIKSTFGEIKDTALAPFKSIGSAFLNRPAIESGVKNLYNSNIDNIVDTSSHIAGGVSSDMFNALPLKDKFKYILGAVSSPVYDDPTSLYSQLSNAQKSYAKDKIANFYELYLNSINKKDLFKKLNKGYFNNPVNLNRYNSGLELQREKILRNHPELDYSQSNGMVNSLANMLAKYKINQGVSKFEDLANKIYSSGRF